jgi:hypothetical protein
MAPPEAVAAPPAGRSPSSDEDEAEVEQDQTYVAQVAAATGEARAVSAPVAGKTEDGEHCDG